MLLILVVHCLVTQSCPTLRPPWTVAHRPSRPSPSPRVCPGSCPLLRGCHPAIWFLYVVKHTIGIFYFIFSISYVFLRQKPSLLWLLYLNILFKIKAMSPHSSTPAWKIPRIEEPGRQQSMGSLRVGHNWATSLPLFTFMHCRREWHPTPVFLPGESQGRGSLVGCCLWGRTESDTTEGT